MGIPLRPHLVRRQADPGKQGTGPLLGLAAARAMHPQSLRHLFPNPKQGIERRHRLLEHDADLPPAQIAHLGLAEGTQIPAVKPEAARHLRSRGQQAEHGQCGHGLAGAGFADQPDGLAGGDFEVDLANHRCPVDGHGQVLDLEQAHRRRARRGSRVSRIPSPSRLSPSTEITIASPG